MSNPKPLSAAEQEKNAKIVAAVTEKIMSDSFKKENVDELSVLFKKRNEIKAEVYAILRPMVGAALLRTTVDPLYAHCETGRAALLQSAHKLFLERLRTLSKEEAIFMLAFIYGELTLQDLV